MAKVTSVLTKLSGKVDGKVFAKTKHGTIVRKAAKTGTKKNEPSLKRQYIRTKWLNSLAGELNRVIAVYSEYLKPSDFYQRVQRLFRREPSDNRLLLLWQLRGMEINPAYRLSKLGTFNLEVAAEKNNVLINLQTDAHPDEGKKQATSYYYEVILLCWRSSNKPVVHARQYSDWIDLDGELPGFEFSFPKPADAIHWLVCIKQHLCRQKEKIGLFTTMGMRIAAVGTFSSKEQALLDKKLAEVLQ